MNYNKYIGLPYISNGRDENGIDCWGLVRLFYKQEYDIQLPSYTEEYSGAYDTRILEMMDQYKNNWSQVPTPEAGSVIVFNILGEPFHVGIYIGEDKFIHARDGMDSVVESVNSPKWAKRIEGYYKYSTQASTVLVGKPHPFKQTNYTELAISGSTLTDVSQNLIDTYKISDYFAKKLILFLDGVKIPQSEWNTVRVQAGQNVVYKVVPEGKSTQRLLLTIAVLYVAVTFGADVGSALGMTETTATLAGTAEVSVTATGKIVGTMAINMAGMALINAAFPIRPLTGKDPGSSAPVNAFSGAANQSNRYGAIPVVLGKMRATAMLGAIPYVETLTDTSVMNLSLVWGFGPLQIDDICVGAKAIQDIYVSPQVSADPKPVPVTRQGYANEDWDSFDKLYPTDVEQQFPQIELVNNATDGQVPAIVELDNYAEDIDIALTFPEGMRKIKNSDGTVSNAECGIDIQIREHGTQSWSNVPTYYLGNIASPTPSDSSFKMTPPASPEWLVNDEYVQTYRWHILAMGPGGGIEVFSGAVSESLNAEPSAELKAKFTESSYSYFTGTDNTYSRIPLIPNGYLKLYTICMYGGQHLEAQRVSYLSSYTHQGLGFTAIPAEDEQPFSITIGAGRIIMDAALAPGQTETIFSSLQFTGAIRVTNNSWGGNTSFLNTWGIWTAASGNTFDQTASVTFPKTGYYEIEASSDDEGAVYIDGSRLITIPKNGYRSSAKNWHYAEANTIHSVRMKVTNTGGAAGAGLRITYTANSGLNILGNTYTSLQFGANGLFSQRKDAFNFVYRMRGLPRKKYDIRVIRTNDDVTEKEEDTNNRYYTKVILYGVTGFNKTVLDSNNNLVPIRVVKNPPNTYLARTFVRLQSTNKVNGSLEGVNALLTTIGHDWNGTNWNTIGPINNPASLFLYVLMHPANAYRVAKNITDAANYVNLSALAEWHAFCELNTALKPRLTYNAIVTSVSSVMDVLKDICSAGKASPNYIDGKWTVVIDKARSGVVQHFTPHNSWGFESTKILPRIPDAFRITIADEEKGYQANEYRVYNIGKTETNAELFEELNLPGVTNFTQAKHIAQWHMAQLKLRPEIYSLNVDFEYLVCNRGDVVRVTHDVPLWGNGSGRIKSCQTGSATITLTEEIYLESGKTYNIRVRTNLGASVLKSLTTITTTGYYSTITLGTGITPVFLIAGDNINPDDLFMLGEVSKESQELVVLSVETSSNVSAKLTLADYSPAIYTADLSQYLAYNSNITSRANYLTNSTIDKAPTIVSVNSDSAISEQIANGTYTNTAIISWTNAEKLSNSAERVQIQVVVGIVAFDNNSPSYYTIKDASSISVLQLSSTIIYKTRARYTNNSGTIVGPWSDIYWFVNDGKTTNFGVSPTLAIDLEKTYIVVDPIIIDQQTDIKAYAYRLYKSTVTTDLWNTTPVIPEVQSQGQGRLDLEKVAIPRISEAGIDYKVECRTLDQTGIYSAISSYALIKIKTIV